MKQRQTGYESVARDDTLWLGTVGRGGWQVGGCVMGLALGAVLTMRPCAAQEEGARLSVRPHEMATGTQTARAGEQRLMSPKDYLVYVPPSCVGTRRCPLVVLLPGGGAYARILMDWHRPLADQYGMIVLAAEDHAVDHIDVAMQQVLRDYAIDPDKIALAGMSDGGNFAIDLGCLNLDVFSRIAPISPGGATAFLADPQNAATQFFFAAGYDAFENMLASEKLLRGAGYAVTQEFVLRGHTERLEDYDQMWSWLHASWAVPDSVARTPLSPVTDSVPVLTTEVLTRMSAFWKSFKTKPDLIVNAPRKRQYQKKIAISIGQQQLLLRMLDMTILAAKYPPVAADLKRVGLTAQQHNAYQAALISARATRTAVDNGVAEPIAETSGLGKNVAFVRAHDQELKSLGEM